MLGIVSIASEASFALVGATVEVVDVPVISQLPAVDQAAPELPLYVNDSNEVTYDVQLLLIAHISGYPLFTPVW